MEEKGGISPSGVVTVKGDEALVSRTEFQQQNPSFLQFVSPTTVVSPQPTPAPVPTPDPASATVTPGSAAASTGSDPTKKKRGRPRKYAPDGSLNPRFSRPTLSPTPISSSIPLSGDYHHSNWKQGRAQQQHQPVEFVKKSQYVTPVVAPTPTGLSFYVGANFMTHQFTVNAGEDITMKIMPYSQQGSRAICILSATGSISNVTLRQPTSSGGTLTYEGRFEILSLSGSFMPTENGGTKGRSGGMSISLAGPNGKIVGGGLAGMLIAAGPVQVVMGSFIVMHQEQQNQKKKPRIIEAYAPPQGPQQPQQQPPTFTITTVNSTPPVMATVEEPKQQPYGSGGIVRPMAQMPSSFHNDNSAMNNFTTPYHGYGNMNTGPNKEEDEDDEDGGDDDSGDTRSQSHSG
ncbi:PREDICTED: AT-hook motif nuclear-localized protein 6-like isoform X1 [Camelina sativa]|uniref:AT-hook motif nuclear-localized protein n=1 Tax=Camelina sativa TaxID=90675 RepID=A0ABM0XCI9_CAMSA|nr:PREDICTED: AT-hook motif nuclear-localized protein 6-like isoform X1 [Camelina sativa]XP_010483911.1 PREDICTED: AT-hook motif nuclear-localized protein 6-like isoform X1 [Camelina sativa]